jgi:membrane-associated phospholipid phosphatase
MDERAAARTFLLLNGAMMDALIAGHDAKYAYWFIRPTQADPSITLAIGLPNHPSYPSTHTVLSKSAAGVLGGPFPHHQVRLDAMAEEASISRLFGGIHYRFDLEAGTGMAEGIAQSALSAGQAPGLSALVP